VWGSERGNKWVGVRETKWLGNEKGSKWEENERGIMGRE